MLSSRTRRSGGRAAALLRLAAVAVGRTDTALGAFYRRLSSRIGKAKAVTATARKVAVLFYNAVRHGMEYVDPGASSYETRYRTRVVNNLHRRAKAFGFVLQPMEPRCCRFLGIVLQRQLADNIGFAGTEQSVVLVDRNFGRQAHLALPIRFAYSCTNRP